MEDFDWMGSRLIEIGECPKVERIKNAKTEAKNIFELEYQKLFDLGKIRDRVEENLNSANALHEKAVNILSHKNNATDPEGVDADTLNGWREEIANNDTKCQELLENVEILKLAVSSYSNPDEIPKTLVNELKKAEILANYQEDLLNWKKDKLMITLSINELNNGLIITEHEHY